MSRTLKNSIFWLVGQFWGVPSPWSTAFLHQEAPQTYSKRLPRERFFKNFLQNFWKIFWNFKKYFFGFLGPHSRSEIWLYQKKSHFLPLFTWFFATLRSLSSTGVCYFFVIFHILRSNYAILECASNSKYVLLPWATLQVTPTRFIRFKLDFKTFFSEKMHFLPKMTPVLLTGHRS